MITPKDLNLPVAEWRAGQFEAILNSVTSRKRFVAHNAPTGCHPEGTGIIMLDGATKRVEQIKIGDMLLGPDSRPRRVVSTHAGVGSMFRITPVNGEPFEVNSSHVLSLVRTREKRSRAKRQILDISVTDYLKSSRWMKHLLKLYRPASVTFQRTSVSGLTIPPYILGLLLGDGCLLYSPTITTMDEEIVNSCKGYAKHLGLLLVKSTKLNNKASTYTFSGRKGHPNPLTTLLKDLHIWGHKAGSKFIPIDYLRSTKSVRLLLLAGLLDTDGHYHNGGFNLISKSPQLISDVLFLCRSVGLAATVSTKIVPKICDTVYYRISISGDCSIIPTRLPRKRSTKRRQKKNHLVTGFTITKAKAARYYGFELDGDHRYLTDDFVVHHNSGKSIMLVGEARYTNQRTLILTGTKALQDQYSKQFSQLGIVDIRGKANYRCRATELGGEFYDGSTAKSVDYGPCQFGVECSLRNNGCTYYDLVRRAASAKLVVANYAAWIAANMYTDGWGYFPLIMCDEAHEAEEWLARMLSISLSYNYRAVLGEDLPSHKDPLQWAEWATYWHPRIKAQLKRETDTAKSRRGAIKHAALLKALQQLERILDRLRKISEDWIVVTSKDHILFHPVWVHKYAESYLFRGSRKAVFASATIIPHSLSLLGIKKGDYDFFQYPSTFPVERRPIYYYPVVKMHYGMDEEDNTLWVDAANSFISSRLDRKGLIHTVSYARATQLLKCSPYTNYMVANPSATTSVAALQKFRMAKPPAILVTPSMATGISLDYKQCEYTIIPKIPFESITDPILMARAAEDPDNAIFQAAQTLVQSIGRAMRAEDDQNECIITDKMFGMFLSRYRHMIPKWIWDAVKVVHELPPPLERLK